MKESLACSNDLRFRFGCAVQRRRNGLGFTQEELSERAGMHRTYLAGIESGARNPSLEIIRKLARALDVSLAVLLDSAEKIPDPDQAMKQEGLLGQPVDILLVEDNPRDAEVALRALAKAGLTNRVQVARDGAEALDYVFGTGRYARRSKDLPHLILMDLHLPKVSGLEVLRRLKSDPRMARIPVTVLTASQRECDLAECRQLGVETYIVKPVDFARLSEITPRLRLGWALLQSPA